MGKKIRFPLKLADNTQARSLEELQEHFDLESVLGYYKSGRLLTWLEDRYLESEAEAIRALDESAGDFQRKLCEVFQVEYTGDDADIVAVQLRQERLAKLRTITDEQEFIDHIGQVAFHQEELADLLDEDETTIYLCGGKFTVPASRRDMTYVGIENPDVHISGKLPKDPAELGIVFRDCTVDNLPEQDSIATEIYAMPDNRGLDAKLKELFADDDSCWQCGIVTANYLVLEYYAPHFYTGRAESGLKDGVYSLNLQTLQLDAVKMPSDMPSEVYIRIVDNELIYSSRSSGGVNSFDLKTGRASVLTALSSSLINRK